MSGPTTSEQDLVSQAIGGMCYAERAKCEAAGLTAMARQWDHIEAQLNAQGAQVYATLSATPDYQLALEGYPIALTEAAAVVQLIALVKQYLPVLIST